MFVIHPLETTFYQADEHDPWEYIWIGFHTELTLPAPLREQAVVQHSGLGSLFSSALRLEDMTQGREMYLCGLIYQLLSLLSEHRPSESDYVEQAQTYLASNYMRNVSIAGLAAQAWPEPLLFQHAVSPANGPFPPAVPSPLPHGARAGTSVRLRLLPRRSGTGRGLSRYFRLFADV